VTDALGSVSVEKTLTFTIISPDDVGMMADAFVFNAPMDAGYDLIPDLTFVQNQPEAPVDVFVWQDQPPLLDLTLGDAIL